MGIAYGVLRLVAPLIAEQFGVAILPRFMADNYASYIFAVLLTGGPMVVMSFFLGWAPRGELLHKEKSGWLRSSQLQASRIEPSSPPSYSDAWPGFLGVAVIVVGMLLSFVVFW